MKAWLTLWCGERKTANKIFFLSSVLILIVIPHLNAANDYSDFECIGIEKGLSQNSVNCILQDSRGFMWFCTQDGLNRYDGYRFVVYKHQLNDSTSLSDNFISSIHEDSAGVLWIGTKGGGLNRFDPRKAEWRHFKFDSRRTESISSDFVNVIFQDHTGMLWIGTDAGLNRFDQRTGRFTRFMHYPDETGSISHDAIRVIFEDQDGILWIGTDEGLNRFDRETQTFTHFKHEPGDPHSLSHNTVQSICEGRNGDLWIGTDDGLNLFLKENEQFVNYWHKSDEPTSLSHNSIHTVFKDSRAQLWIGTDNGLNRFDRVTQEFVRYMHDPNASSGLSNGIVRAITEDRSGIIWIGTYGGGVNKLDPGRKKFTLLRNDANDHNSLSHNTVWSIYEDRTGMIWIGTDDGLNKYDRPNKTFVHYHNDPDDANSISNGIVRAIYEDHTGMLWVGTYGGGLNRFDRSREKFVHYHHNPDDEGSLSDNYVRVIYEDRKDVLWIGTNNGLNRWEGRSGRFVSYKHVPEDPNSLSNNIIRSIHEDQRGNLWIGTYGGLNQYDREKECFVSYKHDPNDPGSLSNDRVSIHEDRSGILWIATLGGGLNRFDHDTKRFKHYSEKDGLPNNSAYSILEDEQGHLWISTNNGLARFNPRTNIFRNYDIHDGLQSNEFNGGAFCKSRTEEMFFGGVNGLNCFHPDSIRDNAAVPSVVITDLQIFNKSILNSKSENSRSTPIYGIAETDTIVFSYKDRVVTFEFAALHYASPDKNEYAYMMEGFEKDWNYVGNRRFATYTNLPPGWYNFRVKGSNNDGVWNELGTFVRVSVVPPFWQTWWFRILIISSILVAGVLVFNIRMHSIHERNRILEQRVEKRTAELKGMNEKLKHEVAFRKRAEKALEVEKAYLEQLFENAPEAIVMTDKDSGILRINNEFTKVFGYTNEEVFGKCLDEMIAPDGLLDEAASLSREAAKGKKTGLETIRKRKDNSTIHVSILGAPIIVDDELVAVYGIYRDITERVRNQEKQQQLLRQLESVNQELKDFAYVVSHDLKAPLRAIASLVEWMASDYKDRFDEEGKEMIHLLLGRAKRMNDLIDGILQYSRVGRIQEKKIKVNLNHLVTEVVDMVAPPENIDVHVQKKLPTVVCEKTRMGQVFENLVSNAVKYMDKSKGQIEIGCKSDKNDWKFSVADNGPGIDARHFDKIFQIFQTLAPRDEIESTGVGLSLVKKIIEMYGGKIWVESEVGSGSTFFFTWPKKEYDYGGQNA